MNNKRNLKDGRTLKKYYCKCGAEIHYSTWHRSPNPKCRACFIEQERSRVHPSNCVCIACIKYIVGHKKGCKCLRCMSIRGEPHKRGCNCCCC